MYMYILFFVLYEGSSPQLVNKDICVKKERVGVENRFYIFNKLLVLLKLLVSGPVLE